MKCDEAMDKIAVSTLQNFLNNRGEDEAENVIEHITGCPKCIEELNEMSTLFTGKRSSLREKWEQLFFPKQEESCEEYSDILPLFVEDVLDKGEDYAKDRHFLFQSHLQACSSCQEGYIDLKEMAAMDRKDIWQLIEEGVAEIKEKSWKLIEHIKINFLPDKITFPEFPKFLPLPEHLSIPVEAVRYKERSADQQSVIKKTTLAIPATQLDLDIILTVTVNPEEHISLKVKILDRKTQSIPKGIFVLLKGKGGGTIDANGEKEFLNLNKGSKYSITIKKGREELIIPLDF